MDKILKAVTLSVWFDDHGRIKPSQWHHGYHTLKLHVLQEADTGDAIRYICKCEDEDEWNFFAATFVFLKRELRWYVEK